MLAVGSKSVGEAFSISPLSPENGSKYNIAHASPPSRVLLIMLTVRCAKAVIDDSRQ